MAFCTGCGSQLVDGERFCSSCGVSNEALVGPPPGPPRSAPPPLGPRPEAPPSGLPTGFRFDWTKLVTGNWVGSAVVAAIMLATAGALSVTLALMAEPDDFGLDNSLTAVMGILAAAFGADAFLDGEFLGDGFEVESATSSYPMTVTIITFVVGVVAFRRMTRDYPSVVPALGDVLRVALFVALPLFVGSLVFRSDLDELGGGWIAEAAKDVSNGDSASWGVSAPSALFVSFALVAFVLALACLARRDWWPGAGRTVAEWLSPAIQGVALLAAVLPLCGLVGIGLLTLGPDNDADLHESTSDEDWAIIAVLAGGLGNGGQALLGLGAGAELGAAGGVRDHHRVRRG